MAAFWERLPNRRRQGSPICASMWTGAEIVIDSDAAAADLSRQALGKHLNGSPFCGWRRPQDRASLDARLRTDLDHDDAPTVVRHAALPASWQSQHADVDVEHAVDLFHAGLFEGFRNGCARVVHQHIQTTEGRDGLLYRRFDGFDIGSIRLDRDGFSASSSLTADHGGSRSGVLPRR